MQCHQIKFQFNILSQATDTWVIPLYKRLLTENFSTK